MLMNKEEFCVLRVKKNFDVSATEEDINLLPQINFTFINSATLLSAEDPV